jgi:hypothetical protein
MSGAVPPLPQYTFMAWCSIKAQGQLYLFLMPLPEGKRKLERSKRGRGNNIEMDL